MGYEKKTVDFMYGKAGPAGVDWDKELAPYYAEGWRDAGGEPIEKLIVQNIGYRIHLEREVKNE